MFSVADQRFTVRILHPSDVRSVHWNTARLQVLRQLHLKLYCIRPSPARLSSLLITTVINVNIHKNIYESPFIFRGPNSTFRNKHASGPRSRSSLKKQQSATVRNEYLENWSLDPDGPGFGPLAKPKPGVEKKTPRSCIPYQTFELEISADALLTIRSL